MKKYFSLTITLILFSCQPKFESLKVYDEAIRSTDNENFYAKDAFLIVPNGGCDGCISEAETFVLDHINNTPNLNIVFTGTKSQKSLKLKLGKTVYNHPNVYIDHENKFYDQSMISIYPTIVYIENGEISRVEYQSPDTPNALASLDFYLSDKH